MGHRGERHQPHEILLAIRRKPAPNNGNHCKDKDCGAHHCGCTRKEGHRHDDHAVGANFVEDTHQESGCPGSCFRSRVGQPGVNRHHWGLDCKCNEEGKEDCHLPTHRESRQCLLQEVVAEQRAGSTHPEGANHNDSTQHDQATR